MIGNRILSISGQDLQLGVSNCVHYITSFRFLSHDLKLVYITVYILSHYLDFLKEPGGVVGTRRGLVGSSSFQLFLVVKFFRVLLPF